MPLASRAVSVTVTLLPELTDPEATLKVLWAADEVPVVTATVGEVVVTATPPMVALIVVAVPAVTPVKVAV